MNSDDLQARGRAIDQMADLDPQRGLTQILALLQHDWVQDYEGYDDWLMTAGDCLVALKEPAAAAFTWLGREHLESALSRLTADVAPRERAAVLVRAGRAEEAAQLYARLGCWARAAVVYERHRRPGDARVTWEAAIAAAPADADPVGHTFAQLGLAQLLHSQRSEEAEEPLEIGLIGLATLAVDAEEARDLRRARERYRVLATIGSHTGQLEHLVEGAVHLARLLVDEGNGLEALEVRMAAAAACAEAGDPQAAATFWNEAARLAEAPWPVLARELWRRTADAWGRAALALMEAGLLPSLAENALLARVDALNRVGAEALIAETFHALADLPLGAIEKERYARMASRAEEAAGGGDGGQAASPLGARSFRLARESARWSAELLERELGDDVRTALMEESALGDSIIARRRALRGLLGTFLEGEAREELLVASTKLLADASRRDLPRRALLGLTGHEAPAVRAAALQALANVLAPDVAEVLVRGLSDADEGVRAAAEAALVTYRRPEAVGLFLRTARLGGAEQARVAVRMLAALGGEELSALDALWELGCEGGAAADAARAAFEAVCPEGLRPLYVLKDNAYAGD